MNILLIGNGFDLAHGLNTRYSDFIELCEIDKKCAAYVNWVNQKAHISPYFHELSKDETTKYKIFCNSINDDIQNQFHNIVKDNFWVDYFCELKNTIGDKWLNFEIEIERVIKQTIEDSSGKLYITNPSIRNIYQLIRKYRNSNSRTSVTELFKNLQTEFKRFTRALEIYICSNLNTPIKCLDPITCLSIDKVISFNYTDTYTRAYNHTTDVCYIHGKANLNSTVSNIVLGFDDHYWGHNNVSIEAVPYEKYYQRIVNKTDIHYLDWHNSIKSDSNSTLYIYGHSLAPSDGDILRKFILDSNMIIKIYCISETDLAEKMANLAVVLNPDNLIKYAGGLNNRIEFIMI